MPHAYYFAGPEDEGADVVRAFVDKEFPKSEAVELSYGLLSVKEARELPVIAFQAPVGSGTKVLVIRVNRFFYEAQNALLKLFEEPPPKTSIVLIVPSEGDLLPTLRSRMTRIGAREKHTKERAREFLEAPSAGREKIVERLLERAKSDDEEEKQEARREVRVLVEELSTLLYRTYEKNPTNELRALLEDVATFTPILHERAAPLKQILEHLLIVIPVRLLK